VSDDDGLLLIEGEEGGPAAAAATTGGAPEAPSTRMRRCVAARAPRLAEGMIRFVVGPDHALVPDLAGRLPGRGLWLSAERRAVQGAVARNLFAKAARDRVVVAPDLADRLEAMLVRRCLDLVGLARRAGELVAGFDQVEDLLRRGRAALVLQARDGAADGRRKVASVAGALKVPVVEAFDRAELGAAIGRAEAVHLALAPGGVERRLEAELGRLSGFRDFPPPAAGVGATEREEGTSRT
jgi:uncharacterized protein